jgi:hypothetical protein
MLNLLILSVITRISIFNQVVLALIRFIFDLILES